LPCGDAVDESAPEVALVATSPVPLLFQERAVSEVHAAGIRAVHVERQVWMSWVRHGRSQLEAARTARYFPRPALVSGCASVARSCRGHAERERCLLPAVPIRHWIRSLPWGLRALLGYERKLCAEVVSAFVAELSRSLRFRAKHARA
jgi:hypothetical protein